METLPSSTLTKSQAGALGQLSVQLPHQVDSHGSHPNNSLNSLLAPDLALLESLDLADDKSRLHLLASQSS